MSARTDDTYFDLSIFQKFANDKINAQKRRDFVLDRTNCCENYIYPKKKKTQ